MILQKQIMYNREDQATISSFCSLMSEVQCDSWMKGKEIIQKVFSQSFELSERFKIDIRRNITKIGNILMLIYVHSLNVESSSSIYLMDLKQQLTKLQYKRYGFTHAWKWLEHIKVQNKQIEQSAVELILQYFPLILKKLGKMTFDDMNFLLHIFSLFQIKRERNVTMLVNFISYLNQIPYVESNQIDNKEVSIIQIIFLIESKLQTQGNMGVLLDQQLIGNLNQRNIQKFCSFYGNIIYDLEAERLLKLMQGLCKVGINCAIVSFFYNISQVLASQEEYYKLKYLFQKFILPELISRCKSCRREKVEETVVRVAQLYIVGFLAYVDMGEDGLECLLNSIEQVDNKKVKGRWVELAYMAALKSKLDRKVDSILKQKDIDSELVEAGRKGRENFGKSQPWEITVRNIRKHKIYERLDSNYSGIVNKSSQCYIISTVQALFMTSSLPKLLFQKKCKSPKRVTTALYSIFKLLANEEKLQKIKIDEIQQCGPRDFALSKSQEDVYEYLLALMDQLQRECKEENMLKEFKDIFEMEWQAHIKCGDCSHETVDKQNTYMHTISNSETIKLQTSEKLTDFICEKCNSKNCLKTTTLQLKSKIFIVHINRFSVKGGVAKKELPTEKILRKVKDYSLVGIIFHIGKNVECGHYVYYSKINQKRWVEFNDTMVKEFELDNQEEQFEREGKAEKTPYILFYKKEK